MSAVPKRRLSEQEYLEIERKAAYKSEFFDGEMFAMAGAKYSHNRVKDNLVGELYQLLKGSSCQELSGDMRVKVPATGLYTYPDALIVCDQPIFQDEVEDVLLNPKIIFEVLSPSTESYDRGKKFENYRTIATLQEYVLLAQDRPICERHVRQPDNSWHETFFNDRNGCLELASIPLKIPLRDLYANVKLRDPNEEEEYPDESGLFREKRK